MSVLLTRMTRFAAIATTIGAMMLGATGLDAATLQAIAVTPANPSIAKGLTKQFTATGTFSDNTMQDLTSQVTWSSATTSVATINAAGLATGIGAGTSTIGATLGGITGSTVLTVTGAALQAIAVTPANPSIPKGTMQQFTATGTFSDSSTQNLTAQVTWSSATASVATINAAGLATGIGAGTSTIGAMLGGITGSTVLTVTGAALQAIAVTPANPSIPKGTTQQFTATGTFSDNSTQNLTAQVTWSSATTSVATINAAGLATGAGVGTSTIGATLGGITGSTVLTVTAPVAPVFQSAVSRKVHGGAGTFDLPLSSATANPTTEPRQGPVHSIVFTFDKPIVSAIRAITEGVGVAVALTFNGNDVTVGLTGVNDQQYVTISLSDVASSDGHGGGSAVIRIGFLAGDVNQNRVVTLSDVGSVNAQLTQPVTAANYLKDVNASGSLSLADKGITNANLTKALPAP